MVYNRALESMKSLGKIRLLLLMVGLLIAIGTAGFHWIEEWSWFDSLYMVITTISTVGYFEVHTLSFHGRLFNIFLIIAGVGMVFFAIGILTQVLLEFELDKVFGRKRMQRE